MPCLYVAQKNFVRRAYFSFFKQTFELKKFSAENKVFPAYMKAAKKRSTYEIFYTTYKQGLRLNYRI